MAETSANNADQPAWDANQYEEALAHIETLQGLIDNMRSAIPSIVQPIAKRTPDKAQLFVEIKTAAVQAVDDIQNVRQGFSSERTQEILTRSQESMQKNGDLSKATAVPRYGWTDPDHAD